MIVPEKEKDSFQLSNVFCFQIYQQGEQKTVLILWMDGSMKDSSMSKLRTSYGRVCVKPDVLENSRHTERHRQRARGKVAEDLDF